MKSLFAAITLVTLSAGASLAADMQAPVLKAAPAVVTNGWSGFYLGAAAGARATDHDLNIRAIDELFVGGFAQNDFPLCATNTPPCSSGATFRNTAFRVGPYAGYNVQFANRWVAGVEADWAWADQTTTQGGFKFFLGGVGLPPDSTFAIKSGWDASLRGRIGFLATPTLLFYGTGGAAWLQTDVTSNCGPVSCFQPIVGPAVVTHSSVRTGWTAGGGIEAMFGSNWIARAEYRYSDYGSSGYTDVRPCTSAPGLNCNAATSINVAYNVSYRTHTAMFGLAYKFGDAAVVARY
jgi:outer membrane immunogenic protein